MVKVAEAANPSTRRVSAATSDFLSPPPLYIALPDFLDLDIDVLAVGGRLSHFASNWKTLGIDPCVVATFGQGYRVGVPGASQIGHPTPHPVDSSLPGSTIGYFLV